MAIRISRPDEREHVEACMKTIENEAAAIVEAWNSGNAVACAAHCSNMSKMMHAITRVCYDDHMIALIDSYHLE